VADYVSKIQALAMKLDIVPGAGHWVIWTHPAEFLNSLREDLRSSSIKPGVAN
jgi:pimeloyl-ACP methyl ester carboxylesterase